jgi:hypothetical protein
MENAKNHKVLACCVEVDQDRKIIKIGYRMFRESLVAPVWKYKEFDSKFLQVDLPNTECLIIDGEIIKKYINILTLIVLFLILNFKIFKKSIEADIFEKTLIFFTFIATCYPLFFLIDRGNLDVYAAILLSLLIYRQIISIQKNNGDSNKITDAILIGIIAGLKPTFGIYILTLLICFSLKNIFVGIFIAIFSYVIPIIVYDANITYLIDSITSAKIALGLPKIFCHNFACLLRVIGFNPNKYFSIFLTLIIIPYFFYYFNKIRNISNNENKLILSLFINTSALLLINDPSPDYRIIFLIPFFFAINKFFLIDNLNNLKFIILILSIIFIFSFTNIYFQLRFEFYTLLRSLGIILMTHIILSSSFKNKIL